MLQGLGMQITTVTREKTYKDLQETGVISEKFLTLKFVYRQRWNDKFSFWLFYKAVDLCTWLMLLCAKLNV